MCSCVPPWKKLTDGKDRQPLYIPALRLMTERKEEPVSSRKPVIKAYCSIEEINHIAESARRAGLSMSSFIRRVCLGSQTPSRNDEMAIRSLLKINADLARLGSLQKMALSHGECEGIPKLVQELISRQKEIKTAIQELYGTKR